MIRAREAGVGVPAIYMVDQHNYRVYMEYVRGLTVKDFIRAEMAHFSPASVPELTVPSADEEKEAARTNLVACAGKIGAAVAHLHDSNLIHGDLTTSNMIVRMELESRERREGAATSSPSPSPSSSSSFSSCSSVVAGGVVLIDFGLSATQSAAEEKAVDLYVMERAFLATHPHSGEISC
jgi:TP53 regulating kinase-like protein